jgi:hypothetical protein
MAQAPQQPGGDAAHFIRQVVPDPKNVPDVTLLTGYLGASSEEAHERLYLSPDLTNYVEVPKAAILHQAPLPKEQDANGGVTLWVKKDAALQYKMAPAAQALANYFAGAIQAGAQAAAPAGPGPVTVGGPACGVTLPNVCQIVSAACTVVGPACQSRFHTCAPCITANQPGFSCGIDCTVVGPPCQSRFGPGCQSHFHTCAPCITQNRTPCPGVSCGIDCTVFGPACQSHFHTCPPCIIQTANRTPCPQVSCGIDCTVFGPACQSIHVGTCFLQCNPTRFQPECPFPTEVTCVPVCRQTFPQPCVASPAPACGQVTLGGCSLACFPGGQPGEPGPVAQAAFAAQPHLRPSFVDCSFVCPTRFGPCLSHHFTCAPCITQHPLQCSIACPTRFGFSCAPCVTQHPLQCSIACPTRFEFSCNPVCHVTSPIVCQLVTNNPAVCPIASGVACPQVSLECPQQSLGCGGFPGGGGFGGQFG